MPMLGEYDENECGGDTFGEPMLELGALREMALGGGGIMYAGVEPDSSRPAWTAATAAW